MVAMIVRLVFSLAALASALFLVSCNTLSKEECVAADWRVVGETDGASGYDPQERFAGHTKSCERVRIVPDQTLWYQGYQAGLVRYCTPLNGLARGQAGDAYANVCPPASAAGFLRGYGIGSRQYQLQSRLSSLRGDMAFKESDIDQMARKLRDAKPEEKGDLRDRIDQREREVRRLREDLRDAEYDLERAARDAAWFQQDPDRPAPVPGY